MSSISLPRWAVILFPWAVALVMWFVGYGPGTVAALERMIHPDDSTPWAVTKDSVVDTVAPVVLILGLVPAVWLICVRVCGLAWPRLGVVPRWNRWELVWIPASFFLACGAGRILTMVNGQAVRSFPDQVHRYRETGLDQGDFPMLATSMLISGPAEEVILVPVLILLLRQGRARPWVAVMIAVAARVGIHLYYGWPMILGWATWALLLIAIWRVTGTVLGAVLAHALNNLIASMQLTGAPGGDQLEIIYTVLGWAGLAAFLPLCTWLFLQWWHNRKTGPAAGVGLPT